MLQRARDAATRLIACHGGDATLVRVTLDNSDPWNPGAPVTTTHAVRMIETGASEAHIAAGLVQTGDVIGVLQPVSEAFVPAVSYKLRVHGHDHTLNELRAVRPSPDGPIVHWSFVARR